MACSSDGLAVVFSEQLVVLRGREARTVRLSRSLASIPMISNAALLADGRTLLVPMIAARE